MRTSKGTDSAPARAACAATLIVATGLALAQGAPAYLDRHCAQQPADADARKRVVVTSAAKLRSGTPDERSAAADTLSCFGEASRAAVPDMIRLFADPAGEIQANAAAAVARLGPVAVPSLIEALGSFDLRVRNNASRALGRIGPPAKDAVPALRKLASAGDPAYSPQAALAIQRIVPGKQ